MNSTPATGRSALGKALGLTQSAKSPWHARWLWAFHSHKVWSIGARHQTTVGAIPRIICLRNGLSQQAPQQRNSQRNWNPTCEIWISGCFRRTGLGQPFFCGNTCMYSLYSDNAHFLPPKLDNSSCPPHESLLHDPVVHVQMREHKSHCQLP